MILDMITLSKLHFFCTLKFFVTSFQVPRSLHGRSDTNVDRPAERGERRESKQDLSRRPRRVREGRQNRGRR
jgi:hypothetical protein